MSLKKRAGAASATLLMIAPLLVAGGAVAPTGASGQTSFETRQGAGPLRPIQRGGQSDFDDELENGALDDEGEQCFDKGRLGFFDCPDAEMEDDGVLIPETPAFNPFLLAPRFTGFNIGGHMGIGKADFSGNSTFLGAPVGLTDFDDAGFIGGGQFGYNWQFRNNVVLGGEIDGTFASIDAEAVTPAGAVADAEVNFTATARARLGYAYGRVMPFVTGGGALIGYEGEVRNGAGATASFDETAFAPVVGGGVNFLVTNRLLASVETHYFFVDEEENLAGLGGAADQVEFEDFFNVRFGLSYKF